MVAACRCLTAVLPGAGVFCSVPVPVLRCRVTALSSPPSAPIAVSFEFFPPRTDKMQEQLWASIERLAPLKPHFVSVTYGAGGSTRERTHETVTRIQKDTGLLAAAHLTCVGASRAEIDAVARRYWESGIRH